MGIAVPKTESKSTWFFLQPREVAPILGGFTVSDAPVKTSKLSNDIFSFAASPAMTSNATPEEIDSEEEELPEYLWYDQEEEKIEDIITQWEDGTAYESPEAAEAWMLEIKSLQEDIDSSPYIDDETQAAYDEQFNAIYDLPAKGYNNGDMFWVCGGNTLTLGDVAFGYTRWDNGEYVDPSPYLVALTLQNYHNYPEDQVYEDTITDSLNTIQEMLIEDDPGPPLDVAVANSINTMDAVYVDLAAQLNEMAEDPSKMTPGAMLSLQLQMTILSQLGEMMSNILAGVNSIFSSIARNFK